MSSRRDFLTRMPALGLGAALSLDAAEANPGAHQKSLNCTEALALENGWQFRLDPEAATSPAVFDASSSGWEPVTVPHTWQVLGGHPDHLGVAWYRMEIFAPTEWQSRFVRIEFEAVFHTAHVFLNGQSVGEHTEKGYTAFCFDLSPHLKLGETNVLLVRVNNSYSNTMLPRMQSFDWANDGGIIRPVRLLVTPPVFIERIEIDAVPEIEKSSAQISIRALVRNTLSVEQTVRLSGHVRLCSTGGQHYPILDKAARLPRNATLTVALEGVSIASPALWHFDSPHLYQAEVMLHLAGDQHTLRDTFGIRRFEARGTEFYLNGERVSLIGVERMAGSHPEFGMAETTDWIEANHLDMKELNCVFTRVHWPQDKRVLDYCDSNGILMQEEVPAWGYSTFENTAKELQSQLEANGLEQLREMIASDRNHPCIVSWGLCNEVNGKNPNSRAFAHTLAKEARRIDPARLLTYASNSLEQHPEEDMAGDFDFVSVNEYFGSWAPGGPQELREHLAALRHAFPDKPIVVSEYGWCECQTTIPPGDQNRVKIVNEHTDVIRESQAVAGAIYFDYNDYRTIVGDKGTGALRQRVHGVVDLYGGRKPSFEALRVQASPIEQLTLTKSENALALRIVTRKAVPGYTLRGYLVRWLFYGYDDLPMDGRFDHLPVLAPGSNVTLTSSVSAEHLRRVAVDVLRPGGFSVARTELVL